MTESLWKRTGILAAAVVLIQMASLTTAHAVPTEKEAWRSLEHGITVYKDSEDDDIYWFIPKLRFEAKDGKTFLRSRTLADGQREYITRLIPYFSKDLRDLVSQNITNIRQDSQLKPVVATKIGIGLPDFNQKFTSASVTNYQYLDSPRLVKFVLSEDDAELFDALYVDDNGVNVDFTINYDGVVTEKFVNMTVSCDDMASELSTNFRPSASANVGVKGADVWAGADLERAFLRQAENSAKSVTITQKGDLPEMLGLLQQTMNMCFAPVLDQYGNSVSGSYGGYNDGTGSGSGSGRWGDYFPDKTSGNDSGLGDEYDRAEKAKKEKAEEEDTYGRDPTDEKRNKEPKDDDGTWFPPSTDTGSTDTGSTIDPQPESLSSKAKKANSFLPKKGQASSNISSTYMTEMDRTLSELNAIENAMSLDRALPGMNTASAALGGGLLPEVTAKMRFKLKTTELGKSNKANVRDIKVKDKQQIYVLPGYLRSTEQKAEKVTIVALQNKTVRVKPENGMAAPFKTGIMVKPNEQWSLNAAFLFIARSTRGWSTKTYDWDSRWKKPDGDLYFRVGSGHWTPVFGRALIESDVIGGGELQFYIDRSSIYNKLPTSHTKSSLGGLIPALFTESTFMPEFSVELSGRRISTK